MKKHLSLLMLFARSTALPFLGLLLAMAAAAFFLFKQKLDTNLQTAAQGNTIDSLEQLIEYSGIALIFGLAFLLITILLCLPGCRFGSRTEYTIGRLSLNETTVFGLQAGYNAACYLILWAAQLATVLACAALYAEQATGDAMTAQTLFLAFYRVPLMHALLPLENWPVWLRNALLLSAIALATARVPVCRRRGKPPVAVVVMALVLLAFPRDYALAAVDIILFWPTALVIACTLYAAIHGEENEHA